jgi:FixJ family two-component response regulator
MALGRPIPTLQLSREARQTLERWVRRRTSAQALSLRARIVLACAEGKSNTVVAREMRVSKPTVGKWRSRFHMLHWPLSKPFNRSHWEHPIRCFSKTETSSQFW